MKKIVFLAGLFFSIGLWGNIAVFYSPMCESCEEKMENIILPLYRQTDSLYDWHFYDIEDEDNMLLFVKIRDALSVKSNDIPLIVIGDKYIYGEGINYDSLSLLMRKYGKDSIPQVNTIIKGKNKLFAKILFFYRKGCSHCSSVGYVLKTLKHYYPSVEIDSMDINEKKNIAYLEFLEEMAKIREKDRLIVPVIIIGDSVLVYNEINFGNIVRIMEKEKGKMPVYREENNTIIERFNRMGIWTVILAGLADGINPCAFATIIFLVSYLAIMKRTKKEIFVIGIVFSIGVFITYMFAGILASGILNQIMRWAFIGRIIYILGGILLVPFAFINFTDAYKIHKGKAEEISLRLPISIHKRIHKYIRTGMSDSFIIGGAFITGFFVSILELACTGQVYLPTILYIMSVPELKAKAFTMLFLYNIMFIVPLIIVTSLSVWVSSAKEWKNIFEKSGIISKILIGMFFMLISVFMIYNGIK